MHAAAGLVLDRHAAEHGCSGQHEARWRGIRVGLGGNRFVLDTAEHSHDLHQDAPAFWYANFNTAKCSADIKHSLVSGHFRATKIEFHSAENRKCVAALK